MYSGFQQVFDADATLAAGLDRLFGGDRQHVFELYFNRRDVGTRQVHFVDHWNDRQFLFLGQVRIRNRLCFNALGCVNK